ncbi:argininosuccinate lyase, partial [Candidatus Woesearchaeota archaeon]|nr:argininosuccinate lyase [Candidatus Woesearchaeota archaeon]
MKLWQKNYNVNKDIGAFTVGNDYLLDQKLVKYDCLASIAHAKMLGKIKVLKKQEVVKLVNALKQIINLQSAGKFNIKQQDEDCHTAIENFLVNKLGNIGKKIHTARSRNDQVLVALRLYEKHELVETKQLLSALKKALIAVIKKHGSIQIPG